MNASMRVPVLVVAAALIALVAGDVALPHGRTQAREICATRGVTITANAVARIYRIGRPDEHYVYACLARSGKRRFLVDFDLELAGPNHVRLAGRYVAYDDVDCDRGGCGGALTVRDVRSGRALRHVHPTPNGAQLTDLELKPNGSIGWIRLTSEGYEVRRADTRGEALLDVGRGRELDPTSLALSGSRLYWTKGGQPFSAELK